MKLSDIRVGARHRRDLGDIAALAASIEAVGLMHPVVVTPDGTLIAGERRLAAFKLLGKTHIPVTIVALDDIVRGEFAENTARKNFTLSEAVAIKHALEPIERAEAKKRQGERTDKHLGKLPTSSKGRAGDKAAKETGMSRRTLEKAEAVIAAAAAEPERYGKLVEDMDETGRVDRAFKQLQIARAKERHAKVVEHGCTVDDLAALAASGKRFSVIYADPPWPWETWGGESGKIHTACDQHYDTQVTDEIMRLPVAPLAADDCVLAMWCTWPHIAIGSHHRVLEAWGFKPSTCAFVWVKTNDDGSLFVGDECPMDKDTFVGNGYATRSNTEVCLLAVKGSPLRLDAAVRQVVFAPVGKHSAKPEEVRRRIERLFPGPYLELYGRQPAPGWTVWGNEIARDRFQMEAAAVAGNDPDTSATAMMAERAKAGEQVSAVAEERKPIADGEFERRLGEEAAAEVVSAGANAEAAAQEGGGAGLEVHEVTRAADLDALSIVGALSVLIKKITEHALSEKYLPEFLDAQPKFDALDLIELAKRLKDFAGYWEAHERRALKVAKSKPQPWNGKLRWMGGNTAMTPWGTVKIVEGELGYRAVRYIDGDEEAIEDTDRSDRDALEWLKAQVQIWCDKTAAEEASSGPDTTIPADLSIPNFMRRT